MSGTTYALIGICVLLFVGYINLHFGKSAAVREVERHRRDIAAHTAKVQHLQAQHTLKDRSREEMQASIDSLNKRLETAETALQREAVKAKEFEEKVAVMEGTIELHKQEVEKCGKEKKAAEDESRHAKIEAEYANDALKRCKTDLATSVDGVSSAGLNAGRDPRTAAPEHKKSGRLPRRAQKVRRLPRGGGGRGRAGGRDRGCPAAEGDATRRERGRGRGCHLRGRRDGEGVWVQERQGLTTRRGIDDASDRL